MRNVFLPFATTNRASERASVGSPQLPLHTTFTGKPLPTTEHDCASSAAAAAASVSENQPMA